MHLEFLDIESDVIEHSMNLKALGSVLASLDPASPELDSKAYIFMGQLVMQLTESLTKDAYHLIDRILDYNRSLPKEICSC